MQYENGTSRISQGLSHIKFKKKKKNNYASWKMHAIEKATEQVMWGLQFTYNVQIIDEGFLKNPKKQDSQISYVKH